jgi:uncharacterized membrane protein
MSIAGTSTIIIGIVIFLTGYWFLGKSSGQNDCKDKPENTNSNYGGGIAGIVIGIILMIAGLIMNMMANRAQVSAPITEESVPMS